MKVLLLGYGSIGKRHAANLRALRPDVDITIFDPPKGYSLSPSSAFDAAIIASPTLEHERHMSWMAWRNVPFYVEKPMGVQLIGPPEVRCAVGFQYRFHPAMPQIRALAAKYGVLHFFARDDLLARYGADVGGVMAAHPIDTSLWLLGPARDVALLSDGIQLRGHIDHERGYSTHEYRLDTGPRVSNVSSAGGLTINLTPDDGMYRDALAAWLAWVEGGKRDERTATLVDGMAVERVLAQVNHVSTA